jgi:hypothetical protein
MRTRKRYKVIKKRQHYVSRYYLKAWADEKDQVICLRKDKIFPSNTMNIAQEKYFYELQDLTDEEKSTVLNMTMQASSKYLQKLHIHFIDNYLKVFKYENITRHLTEDKKEQVDALLNQYKKNYEEDYHAHIEGIGNRYLDFIRDGNISFYYDNTKEDRMMFLFFITLQYMRTKKRRNAAIKEFRDNSINMKKIWPICAHIAATNIASGLHIEKEYKLVLLINKTEINFITSDQPLVNTYCVKNKKVLEEHELEFYYPISPKLSVLITKDIKDSRKVIIADEKKICFYNDMIFKSHEEQIYANKEIYLRKYLRP